MLISGFDVTTTVFACVNLALALRVAGLALRPAQRLVAVPVPVDLPPLSIVVPARNEERQIERCVRSLLAQEHPNFEVIVVDDRSDDATLAILERLALEYPRLRIVHGAELPDGWVGKPWALVQGAGVARGEWLLFTDADTIHAPTAAHSAQVFALGERLDACSALLEQDLVGFAERAVMPSIFMVILLGTGVLADTGNPRKPNALFNGQFIAISRAAYDAIGGHAVVSGCIAEDLELARALKRDGRFRIALTTSRGIARVRMYRSFGEIWNGFVKNFALGVREHPALVPLTFVLLLLLALSPVWALGMLASARWVDAGAQLFAMLAAMVVAEVAGRRMLLPRGSGLWLHPGMGVVLAIVATSLRRFASGRGVEWRGRRYGKGFGGA